MPKNTNRYRGPAERAEQGKAARDADGSRGHGRRAVAALRARLHRPHPRREVVVLFSLGLALVIGVGSLGGAYLLDRYNRDWTSVASVNGASISREVLRGRMAVLSLLAQERSEFVASAVTGGDLPSDQASALQNTAAADTTIEATRQSLIDDELLRELAVRDAVAAPSSPDPWAQAAAYASADLAHRVRYVRFGLPVPAGSSTGGNSTGGAGVSPIAAASGANLAAASAQVTNELAANTPIETIVENLHNAGWQVIGEDTDLSADGVPADASLDLDPSIAAAAIKGVPSAIVGPTTDPYGRVSLGRVLDPPDTTQLQHRLPFDADKAKLDPSALASWAAGRALREAVNEHLIAGWTKGVNEAHFRELVVGPAPGSSGTAGPWVEISGLVVSGLAGVAPSSIAGAPANLELGADPLAKTLDGLGTSVRANLFRTLVAAANRGSGANSANTSGELGFYTKDGVVPDLGKAAFADTTHTGDVIGPITTSSGPELFLVESRYGGTLDDRSQAALRQIYSDPGADPITYTQQFSPPDAALATDAGWRAEAEFGASEAVRAALFDTTIGALSDPFVLDGKLALALVTERRTAVPDARMLDRLTLDGYDAWFGSELAKATITRSDNPLPELMPSASPASSGSSAPTLPSAPALDTPNLPSIPGLPAPTPVPTDALGLPVMP